MFVFFCGLIASALIICHVLFFVGFHVYCFITFPRRTRGKFSPVNFLIKSEFRPVSIIKPLKGCDDNLTMNLKTFFTLNYPKFELLFCVHDDSDPAADIVRRLIEKFPDVDAQLIVGGSTDPNIVNPKINNMNPAYEAAKYDLIMISDDKMWMESDALLDMVDCMMTSDKVGIVCQIPFCYDRSGFGAFVEKMFFEIISFKMTLLTEVLYILQPPLMSAIYEKKVIDAAGGLAFFGKSLCEDVIMAKYFHDMGWKIRFSRQFAYQNPSETSLRSQFGRIVRWCRVNEITNLYLILFPIIWNPIIISCLLMFVFYFLLGYQNFILILLITISSSIFFDFIFFTCMTHKKIGIHELSTFVGGWFFLSLFTLAAVLGSQTSTVVSWKGRNYKVESLGEKIRKSMFRSRKSAEYSIKPTSTDIY